MKFSILILMLFSFSVFANFMNESDVLDCEKIGYLIYSKKKSCPGTCYKLPNKPNYCETHSLYPITKDDLDNPNYELASNITPCEIEDTFCEDAFFRLECADDSYLKIKEDHYQNVYCTKIIGYEQIDTGRKILKVDPDRKAAYLAAKKVISDAKKAEKDQLKLIRSKLDSDISNSDMRKVFRYLLKNLK